MFFELGYERAIIKGNYKYFAIRYPEFAKNMTLEERKKILDIHNEARRLRKMKIVNYDPMAPFSHFSAIPGGQHAENESYGKKPAYFEPDQLYNIKEDPNEQKNLAKDPAYKTIFDDLKIELQKHLEKMPGKFDL